MARGVRLFLVAGLLAGAAAASEPEAHTVRLKGPRPGTSGRSSRHVDSSREMTVVDEVGNVLKQVKEGKTEDHSFRWTLLEGGAGFQAPFRLRREYERARVTIKGKESVLAYEGKTVLIHRDRQGGKCRFSWAKGGELSPTAARHLNAEFNTDPDDSPDQDALMGPPGAVKAGEAWDLDVAVLAKVFQGEVPFRVTPTGAKATGQLTRVYTDGGRRYGVLEYAMTYPATVAILDKQRLALRTGAELKIDYRLNACIDGSLLSCTGKRSLRMHGRAPLPPEGGLRGDVVLTLRSLQEHRDDETGAAP